MTDNKLYAVKILNAKIADAERILKNEIDISRRLGAINSFHILVPIDIVYD
jgi:hypothetical protein